MTLKKFIILVSITVLVLFTGYQAYYRLGIYLPQHQEKLDYFMTTQGKEILKRGEDGKFAPFEIRGVDLGSGYPGEWAVDFAIDKKTYKRWFGYIQDLGANTIRIYTIHHQDFYDAFFEYNSQREKEGEEPLYLLHGVWVNDYVANSHNSAFDSAFLDTFLESCRTAVDVIHGKVSLKLGYQDAGSSVYRHDVSRWVIGYLPGVEWENTLVEYTNQMNENKAVYIGRYLYTTEHASPFEAMLAMVGDKLIEYETERYGQQRMVAFSNWPTTDPFAYPLLVSDTRSKVNCVDVEHILSNDETYFSGMFASYHIYPYFPDYINIMLEGEEYTQEEIVEHYGRMHKELLEYRTSLLKAPRIEDYLQEEDYYDARGRLNTYYAYLKALNRYHTIPVVITEYGITTGRGMAQQDVNTGRNQGHVTEQEQGKGLIECYEDIMASGCAGSCLFSWQDEWFKRTWNTMYAVDMSKTPYWSDYQTNEQFFGIMTFDPGREKSVCYVDGNLSEWEKEDLVVQDGDRKISMKYDEKFVYFLVYKEGFDQVTDTLYIPIDTNPKVGSTYAENEDIAFENAADFLMVIHGKNDSRLLVQERYEVLMSIYHEEYYAINPYYKENTPEADSPLFKRIHMPLKLKSLLPKVKDISTGISYETGKLRYGNANPEAEDFDSLADFIFSGDYIEIRIPWQLLNFSNPSEMMIHDDYYGCYGIENLQIDEMYVGIGSAEDTRYRIRMTALPLKGWGKHVTSHERLKSSYYMLKDYWTSLK